jgi:manganese-dependent inorganic pyrophosphatase
VGETLVFGHKNPDTDSIASAIGYAWYAREVEGQDHVACRLGELNPESRWVLDRFGLDAPRFLADVRMRARDAMKTEVLAASPSTPMLEVARMIVEHDFRAVPVLEDGRVVGIVSQRELGRRYLEESEVEGFEASPIELAALAEAIDGRIVTGEPSAAISGRVLIGASEPQTMAAAVRPGDVLIVGDRVRGQHVAVERGAACLIVSGGSEPYEDVVAEARTAGAGVLATAHDAYGVARRINLSIPASAVMDRQPLVVDRDDLLADVRADIITSPHREALVVDESGKLLGLISRTDLARAGRKSVALVDHSETSQCADGLGEARVVAVLDHHRLGDVQSAEPITVIAQPVGATSSIVVGLIRDAGRQPAPGIAGALLAAILSDTVMLSSPTTTDLDRAAAEWLAGIAEVDPQEFGVEMFKSRGEAAMLDPDPAVRQDLKLYSFGGQRVAISQIETVDAGAVLEKRAALEGALDRLLADRELDIAVLMVTDVLKGGSVLLAAGRKRAVERAFALAGDPHRFLEGVISRKKQVAAVLARELGGA